MWFSGKVPWLYRNLRSAFSTSLVPRYSAVDETIKGATVAFLLYAAGIVGFAAGAYFVIKKAVVDGEKTNGYNAESGEIYLKLAEFPGVAYFDNGLAQVLLSHNHGLALIDFWTYSVYRYDAETGAYREVALVQAWQKEIAETDENGNSYPLEIDTEGAGIVYVITYNRCAQIMSKSEYETWHSELLRDATEIELPWQFLNEQNIKAITE